MLLLVFTLYSLTVTDADNCNSACRLFRNFGRNLEDTFQKVAKEQPIEQVIIDNGYPVEVHNIITEDGYILTFHRIPSNSTNNIPIYLQHGLLCSSAAWVVTGPKNGLGYILADAGYDVWLGNARGNMYSRNHVKYDPDKNQSLYWDFSWHEMGYYDLPAAIDYILNVTNHKRLLYIGHSMGTTMYYVMAASKPKYNNKVMAAIMLAPVAYPHNVRSPIVHGAVNIAPQLIWMHKAVQMYEIFPNSAAFEWMEQSLCSKRSDLRYLCDNLLFAIAGRDPQQHNHTSFPFILEYIPAGTSAKQLIHFYQLVKGKHFQQYDHGKIGNMIQYKSFTPPLYPLKKVTSANYIYFSDNDYLADPKDVEYLTTFLPNVKYKYKVPYDQFNHIDYMWAIDAKSLLYNDILRQIKNITKRFYH